MSEANNVFGINTTGKDVKYKNRNRERDDDPVVGALMNEVFMSEEKKLLKLEESKNPFQLSNDYVIEFGNYLKKSGLSNCFKELKEILENEAKDNKKKSKDKNKKEKKLTKKEQMKLDITKRKIIWKT